jgi:hypothetical protein
MRMVEIVKRGAERFVINNSSTELCRFLLMYRGRRTISTLVIEAASLPHALVRAQGICGDQFQLRMVHPLDPDLANLVRPEQVNRALSPAEATRLLSLFSMHFSASKECYQLPAHSTAAE